MLDLFGNYLSNAHQVFSEDSPTNQPSFKVTIASETWQLFYLYFRRREERLIELKRHNTWSGMYEADLSW